MTPADELVLVRSLLQRHEGTGPIKNGRLMPYIDTRGNVTVGYGRNIYAVGFSELEALDLLDNDITTAIGILVSNYAWFETLSAVRQAVCVDLLFNLGPGKFAGFVQMIADFASENYAGAAREIIASKAANDAPGRYHELAQMCLTDLPLESTP